MVTVPLYPDMLVVSDRTVARGEHFSVETRRGRESAHLALDSQSGRIDLSLDPATPVLRAVMFGCGLGPDPLLHLRRGQGPSAFDDVSRWLQFDDASGLVSYGVTLPPTAGFECALLFRVTLVAYSGVLTLTIETTNASAIPTNPQVECIVGWNPAEEDGGGTPTETRDLGTPQETITWRRRATTEIEVCRVATRWNAFSVDSLDVRPSEPPRLLPGGHARSELEIGMLSLRAAGRFETEMARTDLRPQRLIPLAKLDAEPH